MTFLQLCKEELRLYLHDKWLFSAVSIVPLVLFVLGVNIFSVGVLRDVPIGVIDHDNSSSSRELIRYIDASSLMSVKHIYIDEDSAIDAMKRVYIYAFISIPKDLAKKIKRGKDVSLGTYYNSQFLLIGRSIKSNLQVVLGNFNAKVYVANALSHGVTNIDKAIDKFIPIKEQITPLFNMQTNYNLFLTSIILPCIWQILLVSAMVLNLISQHNQTTMKTWTQRGIKAFFAKIFIYCIVMMVLYTLFIVYFYIYLGWSFKGSFLLLFLGAFFTILASSAMAFMIYFMVLDPSRSMSMCAAYTAPSLAFVGITFPTTNMNIFANIWHTILPISHYISMQTIQANYGMNFDESMRILAKLSLFLVAFLVAYLAYKAQKQKGAL